MQHDADVTIIFNTITRRTALNRAEGAEFVSRGRNPRTGAKSKNMRTEGAPPRCMWLFLGLVCLMMVGGIACAHADEENSVHEPDPIWSVNVGGGEDDAVLGVGWSRREYIAGRRSRWMIRMEGDIWVELEKTPDMTVHFTAAIPHLDWRRQRIGLFVNNRFLTDWQAPDDHHFHEYTAHVPAAYLREGTNRLTYRVAYRTRIGRDSRPLALAVDTIELRAR